VKNRYQRFQKECAYFSPCLWIFDGANFKYIPNCPNADPSVERKAAKKDIYSDSRDDKEENMDDWDEEQLNDVIKKKHGAEKSNQTDIVNMNKNFIFKREKDT